MKNELQQTNADKEIKQCLLEGISFSVIAGAGSGKTTSLVSALNILREEFGIRLRRDAQRIVCITYTKRAKEVIEEYLGFDELFLVSTIHSFLWSAISRFNKDINEAISEYLIPMKIEKQRAKDNGGASQAAVKARNRIAELEADLDNLNQVTNFKYEESQFSNFCNGQIGHDDVIEIAAYLITNKPLLQRGLGFQYPYIFIDEAQDTFDNVIQAFNHVCAGESLPIVGYFGDPMQQIYDNGSGNFEGPNGFRLIGKEENFRSGASLVKLTNAFRTDIQQTVSRKNSKKSGTVLLTLIEAETPSEPRKRYSLEQLDRALIKFDKALEAIDWQENKKAKRLFLARQMIARRLNFTNLHFLFNGEFASKKTEDEFKDGTHFLVKPFVTLICPLLEAHSNGDERKLIEVLTENVPAFDTAGKNKNKSLKEMIIHAGQITTKLQNMWQNGTIGDVLRFVKSHDLYVISDRLNENLERSPRAEDFNKEIHSEEKSDWLTDRFFSLTTDELFSYYNFISDHTPLSTQHGAKGEEYEDVLVVFDDVEAGWNNYNFNKLLAPQTSGEPTDGQLKRSRKLAYVCFSRARTNLRIFLFSENPKHAKDEILSSGLFEYDQVHILDA